MTPSNLELCRELGVSRRTLQYAFGEVLGINVLYNVVNLVARQAKAKGIDAVEAKMPMSIDAKAMITGETDGMIKLVEDKATGRIIGVHFLADHTDTLIGIGVMMVAGEMTLTQVAKAIFPHPTQTELFGELARRLLNRLRRTAKK